MAKLKVKKLEPVFTFKVDSDIKGVINIYTFDTDYANYFVAAFTQDGPHDEKVYVLVSYKDAKKLVEYACSKYEITTAYEPNPFKVLLNDEQAMSRLQDIINTVVEEEWWRT